jgi:hypothetical protein
VSGDSIVPKHVNKSDLQSVVSGLLAGLNQSPSDSPEAFVEAAMMWVDRWVAQHGEDAVKTVLPFALVHGLGAAAGGWVKGAAGWAEEPFFREELPLNVGGKICVTATSILDVTGRLTTAQSLADIGAELKASTLDSLPMVVVYPARALILCCTGGLTGPRVSVKLDMSPFVDLSQEIIDDELNRFHAEHTEFPDGFAHVFSDRAGRVLVSDAEDIVRDNLFQHLKYRAFRSKWIVREDFTPAGRSDISIYDSQNQNRLACVIELKVLRSRGRSKKTGGGSRNYDERTMVRHVRMGTRQAEKYRDIASPPAKWAYVCAFDGRDADTDLPGIQEIADKRGVLYRRYFMQVSARDDLDT